MITRNEDIKDGTVKLGYAITSPTEEQLLLTEAKAYAGMAARLIVQLDEPIDAVLVLLHAFEEELKRGKKLRRGTDVGSGNCDEYSTDNDN